MTTSGTYNWFLDNGDIIIEAFDRCEIRAPQLTREHWQSARRSINLELQEWSIKDQPNLWTVDLQTIPLQQGVAAYTLDPQTVTMLDAYLETYTFGTNINQAPNYSTTIGSPLVTVQQAGHQLLVGNWINIAVPIAVGGLILFGFYQVTTVIDPNNYIFTAASNATSTVTPGAGTVPVFTPTNGSAICSVNLPNHNYILGQNFAVQAPTIVGGVTVFGSYPITGITDANNFTINMGGNANSSTPASENFGLTWIQTQLNSADPIDILLKPIGRSEYAAYPDKLQQGRPTVLWYNRQSPIQQATVWQVPDGVGLYALKYYRMRRLQDANVGNEETADIPYRFVEALCAGMAKRLSVKYRPSKYGLLKAEADMAAALAFGEDHERVDLMIRPDMAPYWDI